MARAQQGSHCPLRVSSHVSKKSLKETCGLLPEQNAPEELDKASLGHQGDSQDIKDSLNSAV